MFHSFLSLLQAPLVLFCIFVAPIWVIMHYRHKSKDVPEEAVAAKRKIEELLAMADKMEGRLATLESILDKKDPNWRHEV